MHGNGMAAMDTGSPGWNREGEEETEGEEPDSGSTTTQGGSSSLDRGQEGESSGGDTDRHMIDWADTDSEEEAQPAGEGQGERAAGTQRGDRVQGSVGGLWAASTAAIAMGRVNQ